MPGPNSWDTKGTCRPEKLDDYDWVNDYWPCSHTVRVQPRKNELVNYDTGEVIGNLNSDYNFYLDHGHIHICRSDWDQETYPLEWPLERGGPVLPE